MPMSQTRNRGGRNLWLALGAINGLLAVALGAYAAHGLRGRLLAGDLNVFEIGVHYQGLHALALVAVGILSRIGGESRWLKWSGWAFFLGILIFSGSLYALVMSGWRGLGIVTPFGGLLFLLGWLLLVFEAWGSSSGQVAKAAPRPRPASRPRDKGQDPLD